MWAVFGENGVVARFRSAGFPLVWLLEHSLHRTHHRLEAVHAVRERHVRVFIANRFLKVKKYDEVNTLKHTL